MNINCLFVGMYYIQKKVNMERLEVIFLFWVSITFQQGLATSWQDENFCVNFWTKDPQSSLGS